MRARPFELARLRSFWLTLTTALRSFTPRGARRVRRKRLRFTQRFADGRPSTVGETATVVVAGVTVTGVAGRGVGVGRGFGSGTACTSQLRPSEIPAPW